MHPWFARHRAAICNPTDSAPRLNSARWSSNNSHPAHLTAPLTRRARELARSEPPPLHLVSEGDRKPRRLVWSPIAMSGLVLGTALFAVPPLTDAGTGARVRDAHLALSTWYVVLAPVCDSLDAISMFSGRQHFAFVATIALFYAAWRSLRPSPPCTARVRWCKETLMASLALMSVVVLYAGGTMLPRPVARLAMSSPNAVVIDFHSHTSYSWDGRRDFSPETNRRWHQQSGFNVAYITDHGTFDGAREGARGNPARAGGGTVLLSGIEVRSDGRHLDILGTDAGDSAAYKRDDLDEGVFARTVRTEKSVPPLVLLTLPGHLVPDTLGVPIDAVEISDGAPRALSQIDSQREAILGLAKARGIALVAGSNNHGWASASPAWSVLQVAGWRRMTPVQLDSAIRSTVLRGGRSAARVVERRGVGPVSYPALLATVPAAIWRMLVTLSWGERLSWLWWIWIGWLAALLVRRMDRKAWLAAAGRVWIAAPGRRNQLGGTAVS